MSVLKDEISKNVKEKFELEAEFDENFGKADSGFSLFKIDWAFQITFGFDEDYDNPWIGIENRDGDSSQTQQEKDLIAKQLVGFSFGRVIQLEDKGWIWLSTFEELEDISWSEMKGKYSKEIISAVESILGKIKHIIENR